MNRDHRDPAAEARALLRAASTASLGTIGRDGGWPFTSLVLVATDHDGVPLLLLSDLAEHSANIAADDRVSLLIDGTAGLDDPLTGPRLTVVGRATRSDHAGHRERYLARHESAAQYADFGDFAFYRIAMESGHLVAGFGRIDWIAGAHMVNGG
jgi:putative heme iron utilization protein